MSDEASACAKAFGSLRWKWPRQVARDPKLPNLAAGIAIEIASYMNRETGDAYPSILTLAKNLKKHPNTIRPAIEKNGKAWPPSKLKIEGRTGEDKPPASFVQAGRTLRKIGGF
jgi:hypothetical protein